MKILNTVSRTIAHHARDFTWNRGCSSNSPPISHGDQIPHPLEDSDNQIPPSPPLSGFHRIIKLETSKHEFADIIHQNKQRFEGKKLSEGGKEFVAFQQHVLQAKTNRRSARKIQTVFLPRFSCLFCLLSSRFLQNNFLDLYLVEIRQYKLPFFAKTATNYIARRAPYF